MSGPVSRLVKVGLRMENCDSRLVLRMSRLARGESTVFHSSRLLRYVVIAHTHITTPSSPYTATLPSASQSR